IWLLKKRTPGRAFVDAEVVLVVVDHLGAPVAVEVEYARAGAPRGVVAGGHGPEQPICDTSGRTVSARALEVVDPVREPVCDAGLGPPVAIEVRDGRGPADAAHCPAF